jgi:hypothetical protein
MFKKVKYFASSTAEAQLGVQQTVTCGRRLDISRCRVQTAALAVN